MAGFFLYVSNTTSKTDGYLCFHEIQTVAGTPSEDQRINCSVHGRYVIYYNERRPDVDYPSYYSGFAYSELCEVEVYGEDNTQKAYISYKDGVYNHIFTFTNMHPIMNLYSSENVKLLFYDVRMRAYPLVISIKKRCIYNSERVALL